MSAIAPPKGQRYLPLSVTLFGVGTLAPVDVWSDQGLLLLARGQRVGSADQLRRLVLHRPMVRQEDYHHLEALGLTGKALRPGMRALPPTSVVISGYVKGAAAPSDWDDPTLAWPKLHTRLAFLLREPQAADDWLKKLKEVLARVGALARRHPDDSLFMLLQMLGDLKLGYSASHALLVALVCDLVAPDAGISASERTSLSLAALTMNIGMTRLHDALATQKSALSELQRADIRAHPEQGQKCLELLGVRDPVWLQLVQDHHEEPDGSGYPAGKTELSTSQRLLHLADLFAARISPRANRTGLSPLTALRNFYLEADDPTRQLGGLMVRGLGLYPPGSFVRLQNGETAVVVRRGRLANEPRVLAVVGSHGLPIAIPVQRDTRQAQYAVHSTVQADEVRVRLDAARILKRA